MLGKYAVSAIPADCLSKLTNHALRIVYHLSDEIISLFFVELITFVKAKRLDCRIVSFIMRIIYICRYPDISLPILCEQRGNIRKVEIMIIIRLLFKGRVEIYFIHRALSAVAYAAARDQIEEGHAEERIHALIDIVIQLITQVLFSRGANIISIAIRAASKSEK